MNICIIGKAKSKAVRQILESSKLTRYTAKCDIVVNYGVAGKKLKLFSRKHPSIANKPIINKFIGCSKYKAVKDAEERDILVPETRLSLLRTQKKKDFLTKKMHSQGGKGIIIAKTRVSLADKYYQKFVSDRKYELRVHAFSWMDQADWLLQKRLGDKDQIAWNYSKGGTFQTVHNSERYQLFKRAKEISSEILKIRHMAFGAVDFIVTDTRDIVFLEINSAPGFTELSKGMYINAFNTLSSLTKTQIHKCCN